MTKPTKTADELKAMIRREAGGGVTVGIQGRPDGGWAFATAHWAPESEAVRRIHAFAHDLQRQYALRQA